MNQVTLEYKGSPRLVSALAQMAEEEGLTADYAAPYEQRDAGATAAVTVLVYVSMKVFDKVTDRAMDEAIDRVIARWKASRVAAGGDVQRIGPRHRG